MRLILKILLLLFILSSCIEREENTVQNLVIKLSFEDNVDASFAEGKLIEVTNIQTGRLYKHEIHEAKASFILESGLYTSSFSLLYNNKVYSTFIDNINLSRGKDAFFEQKLIGKGISPLIIKEIYYSSSKPPLGKFYTSDQFVEIYNNSNESQSLQGLCISTVATVSIPDLEAALPVNQMMWRFPDNAKKTILLPGESVVIAQDAINHSNPLISNSPVNLEAADYETYCTKGDIDNVDVENMLQIWTDSPNSSDWIVNPLGAPYMLFSLPKDYMAFINNDENYRVVQASGKTKKYMWIPKSFVLDAVECIGNESKYNKCLHSDIDASYTFVSKMYESLSLRRKVMDIDNGRVIYMDTNDSAKDFLRDQIPSPGVNPYIIEILQ